MNETIAFIVENWSELLGILSAALLLAAAIAALTPTKRDDEVVARIRRIIEGEV